MKKFFVIAAAAAISFCACTKDDTNKVQGSGNNDADKGSAGLVLNELSGADKFIELYNTTDAEISLEGCYLVKYDSSKEGAVLRTLMTEPLLLQIHRLLPRVRKTHL